MTQKMLSIGKHYEKLPFRIKKKALRAAKDHPNKLIAVDLDYATPTLASALALGMDWGSTEEGYNYWQKIFKNAIKGIYEQDES